MSSRIILIQVTPGNLYTWKLADICFLTIRTTTGHFSFIKTQGKKIQILAFITLQLYLLIYQYNKNYKGMTKEVSFYFLF